LFTFPVLPHSTQKKGAERMLCAFVSRLVLAYLFVSHPPARIVRPDSMSPLK
jgi:hypothetical protein